MKHEYIPIEIRRIVMEQSRGRCAYCLSQTQLTGTSLTLEHIIPASAGGKSEPGNLCLACWECNLQKNKRTRGLDPQTGRRVLLFHPKQQKWTNHFRWSADSLTIIGKTSTGRATITTLQLNREHLVRARQVWVLTGDHPPTL